MASCFQKWKQGAIGSSRRAGFDGGLDQSLRKMSVLLGLRSFQSQMPLQKEIGPTGCRPQVFFTTRILLNLG